MMPYLHPQPVHVMPPRCALCPPAWTHNATVTTVIDGVPLCSAHGRTVAMKRLNLTADDLAAEAGEPS